MICEEQKSAAQGRLPAIHFTLRTTPEKSAAVIRRLHGVAKELRFLSVSPILSFEQDSCAIVQNDPHSVLKVRARGFLIRDQEIISYLPESIRGFEALLPNGNICAVGLCEYPIFVKNAAGARLSTGMRDKAGWMSFVPMTSQGSDEVCYDSKTAVLRLLRAAQKLGVLLSVQAPYDILETPGDGAFRVTLRAVAAG